MLSRQQGQLSLFRMINFYELWTIFTKFLSVDSCLSTAMATVFEKRH